MKRLQLFQFIYFIGAFVFLAAYTSYAQADMILINGKIFTSDNSKLYVQAIAIKKNRILATGTNAAIKKLAYRQTKIIDLQGKTVVPGFNDAHDHLAWKVTVDQRFSCDFSVPGPSKQMVLDSVIRLIKQAKPGQWISGDIGLIVLYESGMRKSLDSIAPQNPVALEIMWGHGMVLNSKAMQFLHITETTENPIGGWYGREPGTNTLTGVLYEYTQWPAWQAIRMSEPAKLIEGLRQYARQQLQFGITTVQDMSCNIPPASLKQIYTEANLPLRIRMISFPGTTSKGRNLTEWKNVPVRPSALSYVSGVKYLIDGTSLEGNSLSRTPYPDRPGWYGKLNFPLDTIRQILHETLTTSTQLHMHIVGDSTLSLVLPLMKSMASDAVWRAKRVRIEHNSTRWSTETEQKYIRDMGIIMTHTPQYGHNNPLRSLIEQGIPVAMAPDGLINPFVNIQIVSSQQANPDENITREQAILVYTLGSAFAEFKENEKGTLKKGMLADMAVLSQDIFTVSEGQLPFTKSVLTIVDGKIVFANDQMEEHMKQIKR
jgi:predicted amidohydrolase YtcJ